MELPYDPVILLLDTYPTEVKAGIQITWTAISIAAYSQRPKCRNNLHPLVGKWINNKKKWYIHRMEYYSFIKRNKILIYATMWMTLEVMLHEISQTQKDKY